MSFHCGIMGNTAGRIGEGRDNRELVLSFSASVDLELITILLWTFSCLPRPSLIAQPWFQEGILRSRDDIGGDASRWEQNCPKRCSFLAAHRQRVCIPGTFIHHSLLRGRSSRAVLPAATPPLPLLGGRRAELPEGDLGKEGPEQAQLTASSLDLCICQPVGKTRSVFLPWNYSKISRQTQFRK